MESGFGDGGIATLKDMPVIRYIAYSARRGCRRSVEHRERTERRFRWGFIPRSVFLSCTFRVTKKKNKMNYSNFGETKRERVQVLPLGKVSLLFNRVRVLEA